jgi:hypothetical protein
MQGLTHADRSLLVKVRDETTKQQGGRAPCCATLAVALTLAVRRSSVTRDRVTLQRCRYRSPDRLFYARAPETAAPRLRYALANKGTVCTDIHIGFICRFLALATRGLVGLRGRVPANA